MDSLLKFVLGTKGHYLLRATEKNPMVVISSEISIVNT